MNKITGLMGLVRTALFGCLAVTSSALGADHLDLDSYLSQVKQKNPGIRGALVSSDAGMDRSGEGGMLLAYTAFANASYTRDAKLVAPLFLFYDAQEFQSYSFGVNKLYSFGLQAQLRYDILLFNYANPIASPVAAGFVSSGALLLNTANTATVLELTQSLWGNGFGKSTRANQELLEAQALSSSYGSRFQAKAGLTDAEGQYWKLATARELVRVQQEALDRANRIYDWNLRRSKLHLNEQSDLLQSEALLQSRKLELASAKNEERASSRTFNISRNVDSEEVTEVLSPLDPEMIRSIEPPKRVELRDDVKAAREGARASTASAEIALQKELPTLDAFVKVALNGQQGNTIFTSFADSAPSSFSFNRPTTIVGIKFSAPIDLPLMNSAREGWRKEKIAAELKYDQKVLEQEQGWKNLNETLGEAKQHLELALKLEKIQLAKLNNERDRLHHGRTTTYQVLLFEQDYLVAELNRIRSQAQVLSTVAQLKLFGETL